MNITYIANIRLPTEKAHGVQIMNMCEAFSREGNTVTLVVPARTDTIPKDPFEYYNCAPVFSITKLFTINSNKFGTIGFFVQSFSFLVSSIYYVLRHPSAVIYTRDVYEALILSFFRKVVFEVHTIHGTRAATYAMNRSFKVIAISQGLKDFFIKQGVPAHKIYVAHDAVNEKVIVAENFEREEYKMKYGIDPKTVIVGYVGKLKTMGKSKGVEELMKAFADARNLTTLPVQLLLVGINADEQEEVRAECDKYRIPKDLIRIIGHVSHEEALQYMRASDILVMNYPNERHYAYFMSPLKLFEYMASGGTILTSDLPSVREVVSDESAYFFRPGDSDDLSKSIATLVRDVTLRSDLSDASIALSKKYTWNSRAKTILDVIMKH